jgi:hypothetical protein
MGAGIAGAGVFGRGGDELLIGSGFAHLMKDARLRGHNKALLRRIHDIFQEGRGRANKVGLL